MGDLKTNEEIILNIKKEYNDKKKDENIFVIKLSNIHTIKGEICSLIESCEILNDKEQCKYGKRCIDKIFDTSYKTLDPLINNLDLSKVDETIKDYSDFIIMETLKKNKFLTVTADKSNYIGEYYYTENKNIDKMISTNLEQKNKKIERKKQKYMLEYNKIEELDQEITKKRKKINYYLNMLKYLIPVLIILILIKILI